MTNTISLSSSQYATLSGIQPLLYDKSFTVECWIKLNTVSGIQTIVGNDGQHDVNKGLLLGVREGRLNCGFWANDTVGATTLAAGQWVHVAYVYDKDAQAQRVYLDGTLDGERTGRPAWVGDAPIRMGRTATTYDFDGQISELRVWDRARSPSELRATMERRVLGWERGLVAHYPLDDGQGTALRNRVSGEPGTLTSGTWEFDEELPLLAADPENHALSLEGTEYGVLPGVQALLYDKSFTVEAWVWPSLHGSHEPILGTNTEAVRQGLHLELRNGRIYCGFYTDDTIGSSVLPLRRWSHVAFVYDKDTQTQTVYVNGRIDGVGTGKASWIGTDEVQIGRWATNLYFHGRISELRIWDHARTRSALNETMRARLGSGVPGLARVFALDSRSGDELPELVADASGSLQSSPPRVLDLGAGDYASLPGVQELLYDKSFTVECWLKLHSISSGDQGILGTSVSRQREGLHLVVRNGHVYMGFYADDAVGVTTLPTNTWVHVAWVYDKSLQTQRIYLNGELDDERTNRASWIGTQDVWLGYSYNGPHPLQGQLSELRIWDHALTQGELRATMDERLRGDEAGLSALYPFEASTGRELRELVHTRNATLIADGRWEEAADLPIGASERERWVRDDALDFRPEGGSTLELSGAQYAVLPGLQGLFRQTTFTVEAWIKLDDTSSTQTILGTDKASNYEGLQLQVRNGKLYLGFHNATEYVTGGIVVPAGEWTHVAFSYQYPEGQMRVYVNGVFDARRASQWWIGNEDIKLGRSLSGNDFKGRISELRIWDHVRHEERLGADLGQRLRGDELGLVAYYPLDDGDGPLLRELVRGTPGTLEDGTWAVDRALPLIPTPVEATRYALSLDGSTQAILPGVAQDIFWERGFTVEAWVYPTQHLKDSTIVGTINNTDRKGLHLVLRNGRVYLGFHGNDTSGSTVLPLNRWSHVAFTYDALEHVQTVYVNGEVDGVGYDKPTWIGTDEVHLGRWSGDGRFFHGRMTELRLWQVTRSQQEIRASMRQPLRGTAHYLHRYYPLDRDTGGFVHEHSLYADLMSSIDAVDNSPARLHPFHTLYLGDNSYGILPRARELLYDKSFTVECWLELHSIDGGDQGILGAPANSQREGLHLVVRNGRVYMGFYSNDAVGVTTLPTNTWVHVAWVYDKSAQTQRIYVNGNLDDERTNRGSWIGTSDVMLGYSYDGARPLHGQLSELRIWDHARLETELRATMNHRLTGAEPGLAALYPLGARSARSNTTLYNEVSGFAGQLLSGGAWQRDSDLPIGASDDQLWVEDPTHPLLPASDGALELGDGAYGRLPGVQALLYDTSFTVECWVKLSRNDGQHVILGTTISRYREGLHMMVIGGAFQIGVYGPDTRGTTLPPVDTWTHVAFTYDKATQTQRIYINGELDAEGTGKVSWIGTSEVKLGYCFDGGRWLYGHLRELRVWGYARDALAIQSTMNLRLHGGELGLRALYPLDAVSGTTLRELVTRQSGSLTVGGSWTRDSSLELHPATGEVGGIATTPLGGATGASSLGTPTSSPTTVNSPPAEITNLGTLQISVFFVSFDFDLNFPGEITVEPLSLATTYSGQAPLPAPFNTSVDPLVVALSGSDWMLQFGLPSGALAALFDSVLGGIDASIRPVVTALLGPYVSVFDTCTIILSSAEGEDPDHGSYLAGFNAFAELDLAAIPPFSLVDQGLKAANASLGLPSIPVSLGMGAAADGDFFVGLVYEPESRLAIIPDLLFFESIGLDVRKQAANVSAGAQIAFALTFGGEELQLIGGVSGEAAGNMTIWGSLDVDDGAWENPFGIKGLSIIGLGVELGFTTDFPYIVLGLRGEAAIGGGLLGARVGILLDGFDVANSILDIYSAQGIRLPELVDALTGFDGGGLLDVSLTDLQLYYAPNGGSIAGQDYDPGLSVGGKLDLWGFNAEVDGQLDYDAGGSLRGTIDRIDLSAGGVQLIRISDSSGNGGAMIDVEFGTSKIGGTINGELILADGLYQSSFNATLSSSGFSIALGSSSFGLYQGATLVLERGTYSFSYGPAISVGISLAGYDISLSVSTTISVSISTTSFSQSISFSFGAMGSTYNAGPYSVSVPFKSFTDLGNAFADHAKALLTNNLVGDLAAATVAAFNWVKDNVSAAAAEVATFFKGVGADTATVAQGLVDHIGTGAGDAVKYLALGATQSAEILKDTFSWTTAHTGDWLKSTFELSDDAVKQVLTDVGYAANEVGDWFEDNMDPTKW